MHHERIHRQCRSNPTYSLWWMSDKRDIPQCFPLSLFSVSFGISSFFQSLYSPHLGNYPQHHYTTFFNIRLQTTSQINMQVPNILFLSISLLSTAILAVVTGSDIRITASQITAIAPKSQSCANAPVPKGGMPECASAQDAAVYIGESFKTYNVTSRAEQAAVIALMAFESMEFRFSRNQDPGVEGQGSEYSHHSLITLLLFFFFFFFFCFVYGV